jgi:hypothetical protein
MPDRDGTCRFGQRVSAAFVETCGSCVAPVKKGVRALIAVLRWSGKRTLAKMNAFDLIVTVTLGSTLATILLSRDVALLEGLTALVLLVVLQLAASWLSVRFGQRRIGCLPCARKTNWQLPGSAAVTHTAAVRAREHPGRSTTDLVG